LAAAGCTVTNWRMTSGSNEVEEPRELYDECLIVFLVERPSF
jgi:hypothetical protein